MANPADLVDPTKAGKYPVILSDELLGKPSTETFTGVRCKQGPAYIAFPLFVISENKYS